MKLAWLVVPSLTLSTIAAAAPDARPAASAQKTAAAPAKVGERAPDFSLPDLAGKTVSLSAFKGTSVKKKLTQTSRGSRNG